MTESPATAGLFRVWERVFEVKLFRYSPGLFAGTMCAIWGVGGQDFAGVYSG